jgi:uncharacterized protein DUF1524
VFSTAFQGLIDATTKDERLYKLFVVLGLSARLYPLIIRLYARNMLFAPVPGSAADLLHCLEVCDIRVYKTRGTDPARGIGDIAHRSRIATAQDISDAVKWFILQFMPDGSFQVYLGQNMYNNGGLTFLLLTEDEQAAGQPYTLAKLVHLVTNHISREHIIARTPNWSATAHGFTDDIDYESYVHTFGNLTLLSEAENSRCSNKPVHTKMTDSTLYRQSMFAGTRQLAQDYATARPTFNKADVASRTQRLANMVMAKWSLW